LHRIRNRALAAAVVAAGVAAMIASAPAGAANQRCSGGGGGGGVGPANSGGTGSGGGTGTGGGHRRTCTSAGYVNPFSPKHWWAGRTDMGVDYGVTGPQAPVVAIGDAKVIGSDSKSGWPGGHFIWYRLLDGDHAGDVIYVAETLTRLVPKGTVVTAGQRIATALHGGTGIETGFANRFGSTRAAPCYHEGMKTNSGAEMARFLRHLGADTADKPGPGPDYPSGALC
jgi:murein DD-endopeptidase MepM/ murein hydrolase activator NlpD